MGAAAGREGGRAFPDGFPGQAAPTLQSQSQGWAEPGASSRLDTKGTWEQPVAGMFLPKQQEKECL